MNILKSPSFREYSSVRFTSKKHFLGGDDVKSPRQSTAPWRSWV